METLRGFPNLPALWLRQAKPAYANALFRLRWAKPSYANAIVMGTPTVPKPYRLQSSPALRFSSCATKGW